MDKEINADDNDEPLSLPGNATFSDNDSDSMEVDDADKTPDQQKQTKKSSDKESEEE
jgi:hypothetical protein